MNLDTATLNEALILTLIGMTTAVVVLLSLLALILVIKIIIQYLPGNARSLDVEEPDRDFHESDIESRDRALAAALAVTALAISRPHASRNID